MPIKRIVHGGAFKGDARQVNRRRNGFRRYTCSKDAGTIVNFLSSPFAREVAPAIERAATRVSRLPDGGNSEGTRRRNFLG